MILLETMLQDLRYAVRMLGRNAGFTFFSVFALALGIGINTVVFTIDKAIIGQPLNAVRPHEMVNIALIRNSGASTFTFSYPDYGAYRDSVRSFSGLIAMSVEHVTLSHAGGVMSQRSSDAASFLGGMGLFPPGVNNAEFVSVFAVSQNFFKVLGAPPVLGRSFESISQAEVLAAPPVLISEDCWQRRFGRAPDILGKQIDLNGLAVTIIGVTPQGFAGPGMAIPHFWMPIALEPLVHADPDYLHDRDRQHFRLFGRLTAGDTIARAQAEVTSVANHLRTLHDPRIDLAQPSTALVWPGSPFPLPLQMYKGLTMAILLVMSAAGMVLLVACANVGSLQLARLQIRQTELHTRLSVGANRFRIIRQLLTESALLGLLAGVVAFFLSWVFLRIGVSLYAGALPSEFGRLVFDVTPDLNIFTYVLTISLFAGILFGVAPAIESSDIALSNSVRAGTSSSRSRRLQNVFVSAQVALSLVLLIAGSLLIRSSIRSLNADTGYDSRHVVDLDFSFPEGSRDTPARKLMIVNELRQRLSARPDVDSVSSARAPDDNSFRTAAATLDGENSKQKLQSIIHYRYVQPNFFETLNIPLVLGHVFQFAAGQPEQSVILSESAAKQLWPGQNPIGRKLRLGPTDEKLHNLRELSANGPAYQVTGVVRDTRGVEFDGSDAKQVYLPLSEERLFSYPILIRTRSDPGRVIREMDALTSSIDPSLMSTCSTLETMLRWTAPFLAASISAAIACFVGVLGLLLALMGIYGTVSHIVALRTREIGIRMAMGAQKNNVLGLVLSESIRPVLAGLIVGCLLAIEAANLLRGVLYQDGSVDLISYAGVSLLFLAIALIAAYPPARRATRIDPMAALRYE